MTQRKILSRGEYRIRDAAIIRGYIQGSTLEDLGGIHAVTSERVRQILVRDKIPIRAKTNETRSSNTQPLTKSEKRAVRKYVQENPDMHLQRVANNLGHSYGLIHAVLHPKRKKRKVTAKVEAVTSPTLRNGLTEALMARGWTDSRIADVLG